LDNYQNAVDNYQNHLDNYQNHFDNASRTAVNYLNRGNCNDLRKFDLKTDAD